MTLPNGVDTLEFDANFLGGPVWRTNSDTNLKQVLQAARHNKVRLLVCRTSVDDVTPDVLGFRNVEVLLTYELPLGDSTGIPPEISVAEMPDADAVAAIAASAFETDRWHADPNIPDEAANAFKAEWARNNVAGRADRVFIYRDDNGDILGFNACLLNGKKAIVDLIAVKAEARGRGIGAALMRAVEGYYFDKVDVVSVGTQQRNSSSRRLYEALGYQKVMSRATWHWTP